MGRAFPKALQVVQPLRQFSWYHNYTALLYAFKGKLLWPNLNVWIIFNSCKTHWSLCVWLRCAVSGCGGLSAATSHVPDSPTVDHPHDNDKLASTMLVMSGGEGYIDFRIGKLHVYKNSSYGFSQPSRNFCFYSLACVFFVFFSKLRLNSIELNLNLEANNSTSDKKVLLIRLNVKLRWEEFSFS